MSIYSQIDRTIWDRKMWSLDKKNAEEPWQRTRTDIYSSCFWVSFPVLLFPLRRKKTSYFIVSLAFADLLVALLVMPFAAIELTTGQWHFGEIFCLVRTSLDVLLTTASILHLCCIALDRSVSAIRTQYRRIETHMFSSKALTCRMVDI